MSIIALDQKNRGVHDGVMEYAIVAFILLIGPLSMLLGADSRYLDDRRGWWPGVVGERWNRLISRSGSRLSPSPERRKHSGSSS